MARLDQLDPSHPLTIAKAGDPAGAYSISSGQGSALRKLAQGQATSEEQLVAFNAIIEVVCLKEVTAYRANDRDTNFALGRQWVGQQLKRLSEYPLEILRGEEPKET